MADVSVYGAPWCPDCRRVKKFLAEHRVHFDWVDIDEDASGLRHVEEVQNGGRTIPTIRLRDGSHLVDPPDEDLARALGLKLQAERRFYDVAIVGGGPAGLVAAIYAAREGMEAIVLERSALGGQAGITERIDNYPGFPEGVGGAELAERFTAQARRYGVELLPAVSVEKLERDGQEDGDDVVLTLGSGQQISAHAAIVATGSTYKRLGVPGEEDLIGSGVHFCATCDGPFYRGADQLLVVGGGNSALEEGLFLTGFANRIDVVQRGPELTASKLLQDKVRADPRFTVHLDSDVVAFEGGKKLTSVRIRDHRTGEESTVTPSAAFVFIGQQPNSEFLRGALDLDEWGFVATDERFQTSMAGVYAAGDVRRGSTKQLAAATGEGVTALLMVREHLRAHHHLPSVPINS
ncbi:MAG TPA: FAD-dependent oxidoreductase [Candidatus Dormibacteraeota bacterium]|jgi:thioredoxin reductase (NADPH)|nr:FAD-dependent oxidoreductase [Candidatus Dormibacteraeota bacterium]